MCKIAATVSMLFIFTWCNSQPGTLVESFGNGGIFTLDQNNEDELQDLTYLSDGSIIASGYTFNGNYDGSLIRLSPGGEVIWTKFIDFYNAGTNDFFSGLVVKNDEIFVQSNSFNPATSRPEVIVLKYDIDGNLDTSFGVNGSVVVDYNQGIAGFEMQIDDDGNLYVVGRSLELSTFMQDGIIIRITAEGLLDSSFGDGGISVQSIGSFRTGLTEGTLINNEFYAVGWFWNIGDAGGSFDENGTIIKIKADGSRDFDFGISGSVTFNMSSSESVNDIAQHGENHFIIAATSGNSSDIFIRKYDLKGDVDQVFGTDGTVKIDNGQDDDADELLVRSDLGIYVCATVNDEEDFAVFSFNADGSKDMDFGNNGSIIIDIEGNDNLSEGLLLPDGNIVLGGESDEDNDGDFTIVKIVGYPTCSDSQRNENLQGCESVSFDGETYTSSQVVNLSYQTAQGCDSTIVLNITVNEASAVNLNESDCERVVVNAIDYTESGTYVQTLTSSNGCDSVLMVNVVILASTSETINQSSCSPISINGQLYEESGSYTQSLTNANGCDSLLTLNLTIENVTSVISLLGDTVLMSEAGDGTFQWLNCATDLIIEGETSSTFDFSESGDYALIISSEMCVDTSDCVSVNTTAIIDFESNIKSKIFPNPAYSQLTIDHYRQASLAEILIFDAQGRLALSTRRVSDSPSKIDLQNLQSGLYFLSLRYENGTNEVFRFVKESR